MCEVEEGNIQPNSVECNDLNEYDYSVDEIEHTPIMDSYGNADDNDLPTQEMLINERFSDDTKHRNKLVSWVMWTSSIWLTAVCVVFIFVAGGGLKCSDSVMMMLLGTTTANILGLPYIVLHGLFDKDK